MATLLPNGLGQSLGDPLVTARPLLVSGDVWFVNSVTGTDDTGTAGQNEDAPLATLDQAIANATDGDIVVLMDGHTETIGQVDIDKVLIVLGAGSDGGLPTVTLNFDPGETSGLTISAANAELRNVKFGTSTAANSTSRLLVSGVGVRVVGCYFVCDQNDGAAALRITESGAEIVNCTFVSTATSIANQPESAIKLGASADAIKLYGVIVDAGTFGFSNLYAIDFSAFAIAQLMIENLSLLRGSDMKLESTTTGIVNVATATGGSRVAW